MRKNTRRTRNFKMHLPYIKCPECGSKLHLFVKNPSVTLEVIRSGEA